MSQQEYENPRIRPICDLLEENFLVPRYQRGYRWGKQEITELLDDILQYQVLTSDRENKVSKFYCLQPVVVKRKTWKNEAKEEISGWELIDGQQRLTTLFIILSYLEDVRKVLNNNTEIYSLDFETRKNCSNFFLDKGFANKVDETNIDFYHISKGYEYVKHWFEASRNKLDILNTILKADFNVSIIWYEAKKGNSTIDLFIRLNEGKIPLTDAELIKALLLQSDLYQPQEDRYVKQRLFEIASEWDEMEAAFQDETFWLFLNDTKERPSSKIEYIFKILADKWNNSRSLVPYEEMDGKPKHYEYLVFDRLLRQKRDEFKKNENSDKDILEPVNSIWQEIKKTFNVFYEWYSDHVLYHYIGYLLAIADHNKEKTIRELLKNKENKKDFIKNLKNRIAREINIQKKKKDSKELKKLNDLVYGDDKPEIIKILLLFNIETLIHYRKENARFPFHLYKKEKITSIEHIHPQNPEKIDADEERSIIWLKAHKHTLLLLKPKEKEQQDKIGLYISAIESLLVKFKKDEFKELFRKIIELYSQVSEIKENEVHTLFNLALVDADTNSALNNSFFDIKREILKENKLGKYIPVCTQRVFLKYYSTNPQEMILWSNEDRKSYFKEMENMYNSFVKLLEATDGDNE